MPVLARTVEALGLSTILVTNMPFWTEAVGVPRTLAVEFPFGHILGQPHAVARQRRVIEQALDALERAEAPGAVMHSAEAWPEPRKEARQAWQPEEPSPVMEVLRPRMLALMRERRSRAALGSKEDGGTRDGSE